jgi:hypothetical protein
MAGGAMAFGDGFQCRHLADAAVGPHRATRIEVAAGRRVERARDLAVRLGKPRPALTFTYDKPSPPPRPDYRLVLVFDPALNLNADPVCAGEPPRFRPGTPGRFYVYAIYCRNDRAMSYTTAWTDATGPTDPRIERLFRELFPVVFSEQQNRWAFNDPMFR